MARVGLLLASSVLAWASVARAEEACFTLLAKTQNYGLGMPRHVVPEPDGRHVLFLRSGPENTELRFYEFDSATGAERELAKPAAQSGPLSTEEKARRERARVTMSGIVDYALSEDGKTVLASQGDHLELVTLPDGKASDVPGKGWIAPRLSPDGQHIAVVKAGDLHVVESATGKEAALTTGATETLTRGLAEFAAAEELDRPDGVWWSPDSQKLLYEEADSAAVEKHFIADPGNPSRAPVEFRYPRAGTENAKVRLGLVARTGGPTIWVDWDSTAYPYLVRVVWPKSGKLSLVVMNREQTIEKVLAVDPWTGHTQALLTETDKAWVNANPMYRPSFDGKDLPHWLPDGSGFLWAAERDGYWRLELHHADGSLDHAVSPAGSFRFDALDDVDMSDTKSVVVTASPERTSFGIYRLPLAGGAPVKMGDTTGMHTAVFGQGEHSLFADRMSLADGTAGTALRKNDGSLVAMVPSRAATPPSIPKVQYLTAGSQNFDAFVLRPAGFLAGRKYPVILAVYAGPTLKNVVNAPRALLEDQCLADHGFIVVTLDGRGTPGRDHDFERAVKGNLIDAPLADQIDGLKGLAEKVPEMDLSRVGVEGWSFGGYFTAMAMTRHSDVFAAGVAGAPVVDFEDYDTAYTERFLGTPQAAPQAYHVSNVLTYASGLKNPLLIFHGLTDDNVYFENTVKLTQALLAAGKSYQLVLLPGTHMLTDPVLRARVNEMRATFLQEKLGTQEGKKQG